jgi:2-polyprenyl-3-methyl-5-hydroxy-6-metoxy-1,4-benzoquinol methylase
LDVGCGGGDVPLACHHLARSRGVELDLTVLDQSATALAHASARAAAAQVALRCVEADVSAAELRGPFDVVTCSLLLHHLPRPVAGKLLAKMAAAARLLVVVQDLRRCVPGYAAAWLASRLVTRSKVVHHDGPVSVRAAFTPAEAREMARDAGLNDVEVTTKFPWRWVLVWERPQAQG